VDKVSAAPTYNDPALTDRLAQALKRGMSPQGVVEMEQMMVSEDFGRFGLDGKIPTCMLNVGAVDPAKIASGVRLPSLHSSEFAPWPDPTIRAGVKAMTTAAMELLRKKKRCRSRRNGRGVRDVGRSSRLRGGTRRA